MNRDSVLWLVVLSGPVVWMVSFGLDFGLSGWTCGWGSKLPLYLISITSLLLTAIGAAVAFEQWRAMGKTFPGEGSGAIARARAMAIGGIALNVMFFIAVISLTIPQLLLRGCE